MRVTRDDWGTVRIYLDKPLKPDFEASLLAELLAFARPYGRGAIAAERTRSLPLKVVVAEGLRAAAIDMNGLRRRDGMLYFDYVAGHRIKVLYHPAGVKDLQGLPVEGDMGLPVLTSREFDLMYGTGALESAVKLALL